MVVVPVATMVAQKVLPATVFVGAATGVAAYVRSQLKTESNTMDHFFAQYKSPQSELSRQRTFEGAQEDPRKSLFNVLGW